MFPCRLSVFHLLWLDRAGTRACFARTHTCVGQGLLLNEYHSAYLVLHSMKNPYWKKWFIPLQQILFLLVPLKAHFTQKNPDLLVPLRNLNIAFFDQRKQSAASVPVLVLVLVICVIQSTTVAWLDPWTTVASISDTCYTLFFENGGHKWF